MTPAVLERYNFLYEQHLINLKLQGKRSTAIQAYSRAVRLIARFFDCCPDSLTKEQLKFYFSSPNSEHTFQIEFKVLLFWRGNG